MEVLESLIGAVRRCCAGFPDRRTGTNVRYPMPDIGMGAFSLFFVQSPSFLDFQRRLEAGHGRSNCQTLFGMSRIPTDNHNRAMLDPVAPDHLFPVFDEVVAALERSGGLGAFRRLGSRRRATPRSCRSSPSSSGRRTGTTSRPARAAPCGAGPRGTALVTRGSTRSISATIF